MPVYNAEPYLHESMDSLVNQTLKEIEIICVNDGSTDGSLSILEEYAKQDDRVVVISQDNQGQGVARNAGLSLAKGEYISFLDPDDFFSVETFLESYEKAKKLDLDVLVFAVEGFDKNTKERYPLNVFFREQNTPQKDVYSYKDMLDSIFRTFNFSACNKIFRRDFINQHSIKFALIRKAEDIAFTSRALVKAQRMSGIRKVFLHYRTGNPFSTDATLYKVPLDGYYALKDIMIFLKEEGYPQVIQDHFAQVSLGYLMVFLNNSYHYFKEFRILYNHIRENIENDFGIGKLEPSKLQRIHYENYLKILNLPFDAYLHDLLMEKEKKEKYNFVRLIRQSYPNLSFFGAGVECQRMLTYFRTHDIPDPIVICDNNPQAQNELFWGIPVISFEDYLAKYENKGILITCLVETSEIYAQVQGALAENDIFKVEL